MVDIKLNGTMVFCVCMVLIYMCLCVLAGKPIVDLNDYLRLPTLYEQEVK